MPHLACTLRAIAFVVGLVHCAAGLLGAQELFEPRDSMRSTAYLADFSPSPPDRFDLRLEPLPHERFSSLPAGEYFADLPPDERIPNLFPGASTEWPGPAASDVSTPLDGMDGVGLSVRERFRLEVGNLWVDFDNYYCSWPTYRNLAIAFGVGAALANTSADEHFQDWYQDHVRTDGTDRASSFFRAFGEGAIFIPAWVGVGLVGAYFDESPYGNVAAEFGFRTTRAYLVGGPAMLLGQYLTGASRPDERPDASHWRPFQDSNGVSGHAFIGAVPFMTAARMVESPWLKGLFYFGSALPAWSRVNDNKHFLSQAILGWCMAYVACDAVDRTELATTSVTVMPVINERMVGMGVLFQY